MKKKPAKDKGKLRDVKARIGKSIKKAVWHTGYLIYVEIPDLEGWLK